MWEGEMGGNPALGAPGSNTYTGLIASSTIGVSGSNPSKAQALSHEDATDLCLEYQPLVLSLAARYSGKGIDFDELKAAGQLGLVRALRGFDPDLGYAFGAYAKPWVTGEITSLFKPTRDALSFGRSESLDAPIATDEDENEISGLGLVPDNGAPPVALNLATLDERERIIFDARTEGKTLDEIGGELGVSRERIRQLSDRLMQKVRSAPGNVARLSTRELFARRGREEVLKFPVERTQRWVGAEFRDRDPPKHEYHEPQASRELAHHRAKASHLASLRGNAPVRNRRGPYGGPVIHAWGRP